MPIHDYVCRACQHRFEALQAILATAPNCPLCAGATEKLPSAPAVHGFAAKGREAAQRTLRPAHAVGCPCCTRSGVTGG